MRVLRNGLGIVLITATLLGASVSSAGVDINIRLPSVRIELRDPPPPLRDEWVPKARRGYIWHPGYWRWDAYDARGDRGDWVWVPGVWLRERPGRVWLYGGWQQRDERWIYEPGHWTRGTGDWRAHQRREWDRWAHERERQHDEWAREQRAREERIREHEAREREQRQWQEEIGRAHV